MWFDKLEWVQKVKFFVSYISTHQKVYTTKENLKIKLCMVLHTWNPSYSGGRDRRIMAQGQLG
jgi:hypothetical protein